jgi:hypothetical protein
MGDLTVHSGTGDYLITLWCMSMQVSWCPRGKVMSVLGCKQYDSPHIILVGRLNDAVRHFCCTGEAVQVWVIVNQLSLKAECYSPTKAGQYDWEIQTFSWPLTSCYCWGQEDVNLYIHSSICFHGVMLRYLCTGSTSLPLLDCVPQSQLLLQTVHR